MATLLAARDAAQYQDDNKPLTIAERRKVTLAQLEIQEQRFRLKIVQIQAYRRQLLVIGADPARFGDDRFSLAWRKGRKVSKVESRVKLDTVAGAYWIKQVIDVDKPSKVFIDLGGMGSGVFDILQSWGEPYSKIVVGVNFGGAPREPVRYLQDGSKQPGPKNRRAEIWEASRSWLNLEGGVDIPDSDSLQADACGPGYHYDLDQRLILEDKAHMRQRGVRSPDEWDAIALTFSEPVKVTTPRATAEPVRRHQSSESSSQSWMAH